jgi:hypothetical protein
MSAPLILKLRGCEMNQANRFAKFSGVYVCRCCGRKTRSTGRGDNENCQLCAECYDLAGIENEISDNGIENVTANTLAEAGRLYRLIGEKGGKYVLEYPEIANV